MNRNNIIRGTLLLVLIVGLLAVFAQSNAKLLHLGDAPQDFTYSQFLENINGDNVLDGNFDKDTFQGHTIKPSKAFVSSSKAGYDGRDFM